MRTTIAASGLLIAATTQAGASGLVYVHRHELPAVIARQHTCVPSKGRTDMLPRPLQVGRKFIFVIGCPDPGATPGKSAEESTRFAYYVGRDKAGRDARRLVFPYPQPDGSEVKLDALPALLDPGWSTRADTSKMGGEAYLSSQRHIGPGGAFHLMARLEPAERPQLATVVAIWEVRDGAATQLIYWAETTERLRGEAPAWIYPNYQVKLDRRPER